MKIANISVAKQEPASYFLIKNVDDLLEYQEFLNKEMQISMVRVMRSEVRPERWNHILRSDSHGDSVLMHSYLKCHIQGGSPLLTAPVLFQQKIDAIKKYLFNGKIVIINQKGGYCFLDNNTQVFSIDEYIPVLKNIYHIGKNTKIINFENDPSLEKRTLAYFKEQNDSDPSYILNLREHSIEDITRILNEFHNHGGHTVYVYTTGMDTPQMYDYSKAIINSPLKKVVFEFNAGYNTEHQKVVNFLKCQNIDVSVINEE